LSVCVAFGFWFNLFFLCFFGGFVYLFLSAVGCLIGVVGVFLIF